MLDFSMIKPSGNSLFNIFVKSSWLSVCKEGWNAPSLTRAYIDSLKSYDAAIKSGVQLLPLTFACMSTPNFATNGITSCKFSAQK